VRRVTLLPNGRRALIRRVSLFPMGNTWVTNGRRVLIWCVALYLSQIQKIVTSFSKNCYIKAHDAQNSHK
jgi:hypothetical protein